MGLPATPDDEPLHEPGADARSVVPAAPPCPEVWPPGGLRASRYAVFVGGGRAPEIAADPALRAGVEGLLPEELHAPVVHNLDRLAACFRCTAETVSVDVRLVILADGRALSIDNNAPDAACVSDVIRGLTWPRKSAATFARFRLDYTVKPKPVRVP